MALLQTIKIQTKQVLNIFNTKEVAEHFLDTHYIPFDILQGISGEILEILESITQKTTHYRILETGMGTGRFSYPFAIELAEKFPDSKLYGLDSSRAMLSEAEKYLPPDLSIKYEHGSLNKPLSYPLNFFDASISFYVYHCIKKWKQALNNVIRMIRKPILLFFIKERSQWGFHLDNRFDGIEIFDVTYYRFWKEYFKNREILTPLPKVDISASNLDMLGTYLEKKGFQHITKISDFKWKRKIDYREALQSINLGLFTKLRIGLSAQDRAFLRKRMEDWLSIERIDYTKQFWEIPAAIEIDVFYTG